MKDNNTHDNGYSRSHHIEDLLPLYALGGLTEEEIRQVDAHLAEHPEAAAELADFMKTVEGLPFATAPMKPSAEMEARLMSRVEANAAARFPDQSVSTPAAAPASMASPSSVRQAVAAPSPPQANQPTLVEWFMGLFTQPAFALVPTAVAAFAIVWGVVITQQLNQANQQSAILTAQVNTLTAQNGELNTAVANTSTELSLLEGELSDLTAENEELTVENEGLTGINADLLGQIDTLIADNDSLGDLLAAVEGDAAALQNQLASLADNNETLSDQLADQQVVLDLFASPGTQTISLPGTESRPEAGGQLLVDPNSNIALLVVSDLQPLEEGQVYQVLLIRDDGHDTADTFMVDAEGENILLVNSTAPLSDFTAVGISIEPEGGSPQRTGDIIILGEL